MTDTDIWYWLESFWYVDQVGDIYIFPKDDNVMQVLCENTAYGTMFDICNRVKEKNFMPDPEQAFLLGLIPVPAEKRGWEKGRGSQGFDFYVKP